jgi:multicomponent Na+:H+ antiporter subunit B
MKQAPLILTVFARPLYGLILLAALWILLRGHNEPGGGFIAGLVAACATLLQALATDSAAAAARLPGRAPLPLAVAGVLLALASGLPALFLGLPYLTHLWGEFLGLPVSTVLLFDTGVFLCVWGSVAGYALALIERSEAAP